MKKTFFILLMCSLWITGFSQPGASLTVSSSNNQRFWLFIDDVLQNEYSVPSIRIQGMQFRQYRMRIEMDNVNANCVGQLIAITNQRDGNNYSVSGGRNNAYSIVRSQGSVRPVLSQNLIQPNYNYYNYYYQYLFPGFGNMGNYWQGSGGNQGRQYQLSQHNNDWNQGGNPPPRPPGGGQGHGGGGTHGNYNCRNQMEFATAMNVLSNEPFESGKLQFAKNMTASGPICVEQIIQICNVFTQESSKLEFAKFAYQYCSDKNLYYMVNSVFSFQSSKDELSRFLR